MKKTFMFLFCSLNLFAYKVEKVENKNLTVYQNKVFVEENLKLKEDGNKNQIIYSGIPRFIDINSIKLDKGSIDAIDLDVLDSYSTLKNFIGKEISVEINGKFKDVILLDNSASLVVKDKITNEVYVLKNPNIKLKNSDLLVGNKLTIKGRNFNLNPKISYLSQSLTFNIFHRLDVSSEKLEVWGKIFNSIGKDLIDTNLKLVYENQNFYAGKNQSIEVSSTRISRSETGEKIEYILKDKVTLKNNKERSLKLEDQSVSLKEIYKYNTRDYSKNPTKVIELQNKSSETIPGGPIYVWDEEGLNSVSNLPLTLKGKTSEIRLKKNFKVVIDRKVKKVSSLNNNQNKREIEIDIENSSNKEIELEITYNELPKNWDSLKTNFKYEKISNNEIRFNLKLKGNQREKLEMSYIEEKN